MTNLFSHTLSPLAVDLTCVGAPVSLQRERDPETEIFILSRLAGLAKLLDGAGIDLITLGETFRIGGKKRRDDFLDGVRALAGVGRHTFNVRLAASIPLSQANPRSIASTIGALHKATDGRAGWHVDAPTPEPSSNVGTVVSEFVQLPAPTTVVVNVRSDLDVEIAAARATVARLRVGTVEAARTLRAAIRGAAADWGRNPDDISVLVDVHTVLSDTAADADARALFLEDLDIETADGLLRHVGTAQTLATVWQNWVRAGAADGFTILPASIPTDVIQIATKLLPELDARGLRTTATPVATPARARSRKRPVAV